MSEISEKAIGLVLDLLRAAGVTKMEGDLPDADAKLMYYIAELETENAALKEENSRLKQDPQPLEFWSEEKMQAYADNMGRSARNSSDTGEWKTELPEVEA